MYEAFCEIVDDALTDSFDPLTIAFEGRLAEFSMIAGGVESDIRVLKRAQEKLTMDFLEVG